MATKKCPYCKKIIDVNEEICPHCKNPLTRKNRYTNVIEEPKELKVTREPSKKSKKTLLLLIPLVIVVGLGLFGYKMLKENEYKQNLSKAVDLMVEGATLSEDLYSKRYNIWYNSLYKINDSNTDKFTKNGNAFYDDFNDALDKYYEDDEYLAQVSNIQKNYQEVVDAMRALANPPKKYNDIYIKMKSLYEGYCKLRELSLNPAGYNLNSYSEKYHTIEEDLLEIINQLMISF